MINNISSNFKKRVAFCLTTAYRDKKDVIRADLAIRTIKLAINKGYSVFICDNNSLKYFTDKLSNLDILLIKQKKESWGKAKRRLVKIAYNKGKDIIVFNEPEKVDFVKSLDEYMLPIYNNKTDIVVFQRRRFNNYPLIQTITENVGNFILNFLLNTKYDYFFGPIIFNKKLKFTNYHGEYGDKWEASIIPLIDAIYKKVRISKIKINYKHPLEQKEHESGDYKFIKKRFIQLEHIITAIIKHKIQRIKTNSTQ